ncbi:CASP-like protein 1 [Rutidosis leptorrhynchoides]|uniref:CASP-like protein 1 n=1 Tax=Rutidosis leptorrhynchoides TaxID=125765 RepID=UPI003A99059B
MAHNGATVLRATSADIETPVKADSGDHGVKNNHGAFLDVALRMVLLASALSAVFIIITSKESKIIHLSPTVAVPLQANWDQSPAYIYYVVALFVTCLHSVFTGILSVTSQRKMGGRSTTHQFYVATLDSVLLGIVSSALGAALGVGYIGLKGNKYSFWKGICSAYGSFCHHLAYSLIMGLTSAITILLLVCLSFYSLRKKIIKP